jgi:hypothetical protein
MTKTNLTANRVDLSNQYSCEASMTTAVYYHAGVAHRAIWFFRADLPTTGKIEIYTLEPMRDNGMTEQGWAAFCQGDFLAYANEETPAKCEVRRRRDARDRIRVRRPVRECPRGHGGSVRGAGAVVSSKSSKKWTKTDLRSLTGAIDGWWLSFRMYLLPGVTKEHVFKLMPLEERTAIVVAHFRSFAALLDERINGHTGYRVTWQNYDQHNGQPGWGDTADIVKRFQDFEADTLVAIGKAHALAVRVEAEGLPADVVAYVPAH